MKVLTKIFSVFLMAAILLMAAVVQGQVRAQEQVKAQAEARPKLIVLLSIDQMRPDRLDGSLPGGLGRLFREGHVFTNVTLNHGLTNTCPGHVVMSTGVNPGKAGIPGNSYLDHDSLADRYCVDDPDSAHQVLHGAENRSPNSIRVTSLGDRLKSSSLNSKVFSVSGKDRSAIALGGKSADGAFWFHQQSSRFTSSRYYTEQLPKYVIEFNGESFFDDGYGKQVPEYWQHDEGTYRIDDYPGESEEFDRVSGHPVNTVQAAAEVTVRPNGTVQVNKITAALDCGNLVNPMTAEEQVEGAILFGLTATINGKLTIENGQVLENNLDTYEIVGMKDAPEINIHWALSGGDKWGGLGEPAVPVVAPAICNALYKKKGRRIRSLPIRDYYLQVGSR